MTQQEKEKGSALPVIAAILIGVGLLFVSYSHFSRESREVRLETAVRPELERIARTIAAYVAINGELPCPADATLASTDSNYGKSDATLCKKDSSSHRRQIVPWVTLGLDNAIDPWGQFISYHVANDGKVEIGQGFSVCLAVDDDGSCTVIEDDRAFILISHGEKGRGGYSSSGTYIEVNEETSMEAANSALVAPHLHYFGLTARSQQEGGFDHVVVSRAMASLVTTPQQPDDDCIPNVFGGGLATHGDGGITLDGSPNLNNLTSYTFTTKVLNKPSWYQYDSIKSQYAASGSASDTVPIPDAPAAPSNTSTEDYRAGPWPDVNRTLTGDQAFKSLTVTSGGSLTLDSTGNMTVNVREAVTLGPHWLKAEGDVTLHAGSFSLAGGHTATFKGAGNTVLNIHGNATLGGGGILNIEGDSFLYTKDLTISGGKGISVTGGDLTIVVDGDLTIGGADAIVAAPPASALILVKGDVTLQGSASAQAYIYADGDARMTGAARLNGSLVAKSILMNGSATLNYTTNVPKGVGDCD